jgi:hypothetical protein
VVLLYSECVTEEGMGGLGELKIEGQINNTVKCADDLVLLGKREMVLQGVIGKLIDIGTIDGMGINVEKRE